MKLKPCPFCGDDKPMPSHSENGEWRYVSCWGCDATTGPHETAEKAVDAWNRRSPPSELSEAWMKFKANKSRMTQPMYDVLDVVKKLCEAGKGER